MSKFESSYFTNLYIHFPLAGIYIHIPFCQQACYYCDFYFSTSQKMIDPVIDAICKELSLRKKYHGDENISTIYLGGGTPSLLNPAYITRLLDAVYAHYSIKSDPEITMEANPEDISKSKLNAWEIAGINRLSLGVQSFDNKVLAFMNRVHNEEKALASLDMIRTSTFINVNVDLIYGVFPGNHRRWEKDLEILLKYRPEHISAYNLTIEENTVFGRRARRGKLQVPDDDFSADEYEILISMLKQEGYLHYEISNFCLPGYESQHNSGYWKNKYYLGVGPAAHSFNFESRQSNVANSALYVRAIADNKIPATIEPLSRENQINDYILTSLRTMWGTSFLILKEKWEYDLLQSNHSLIDRLKIGGMCRIDTEKIVLTEKGFLLADKIASGLFISS